MGGSFRHGTCATTCFASSSSSAGSGSFSSPYPGPVVRILRGLAPTKLYRPTCSVAADSNRNEYVDEAEDVDLACAETLRYAAEGVMRSEEIWR